MSRRTNHLRIERLEDRRMMARAAGGDDGEPPIDDPGGPDAGDGGTADDGVVASSPYRPAVRGSLGNAIAVEPISGFDAWDASTDDSPNTAFRDGALRLNYKLNVDPALLQNVALEAIDVGGTARLLGSFADRQAAGKVVNLAGIAGLSGGDYQLRLRVDLADGTSVLSTLDSLKLLDASTTDGTFNGETLTYNGGANTGVVIHGKGGTDTLDLGVSRADVVSFNGDFGFISDTTVSQAIYRGTAYDFLRLADGREVYFQGIERLRFSDGSISDLVYRPNDPEFANQWNLHVTDVPGAWRFTLGASHVILVSIDDGLLNAPNAPTWAGVFDLNMSRLVTDPTDDNNFVTTASPLNYPFPLGHGHSAISVMASAFNNGEGVAGINQGSTVMVTDVYQGVDLQTAIRDSIIYARTNGKRVVFQGGVQGEYWLTNGGATESLRELIANNSDMALFAMAAGNGGPGGNLSDPIGTLPYDQSVSGVARLEEYHNNVISVGALASTATAVVDGLTNASQVAMASYSNRGPNLTLVAPTDSPAVDKRGLVFPFGGTSCANPNLAAMASLVWSVNPNLTGGEVRQILIDSAYDLGNAGDDDAYGHGLVNAEAAVRRAAAFARSGDVAGLYEIFWDFPHDDVWTGNSNGGSIGPVGPPGAGYDMIGLVDLALAAAEFDAELQGVPTIHAQAPRAEQAAGAMALNDYAFDHWQPAPTIRSLSISNDLLDPSFEAGDHDIALALLGREEIVGQLVGA